MTEAERPGGPPSGNPTPEEISARLEALLKRTHAMRAEKAAMPASAGVTWPPSERELKHYDVVDVDDRDKAAPSLAPASPPPRPQGTQAHASTTSGDTAPEFGRPGWGELRLRQGSQEPAGGTRWLPVVAALLLAATIGQAAYIWYLHDSLGASGAGHLRVNGPAGAEVRVDGSAVGNAPLDYVLTPGEYDVQVGTDAAAQRVSIERARTVVLLPAAAPERASGPPTVQQPAVLSTPPVAQRPDAFRLVAPGELAHPAWAQRHDLGHLRRRMPLRQQPDHLAVAALNDILRCPKTLPQLLDRRLMLVPRHAPPPVCGAS